MYKEVLVAVAGVEILHSFLLRLLTSVYILLFTLLLRMKFKTQELGMPRIWFEWGMWRLWYKTRSPKIAGGWFSGGRTKSRELEIWIR